MRALAGGLVGLLEDYATPGGAPLSFQIGKSVFVYTKSAGDDPVSTVTSGNHTHIIPGAQDYHDSEGSASTESMDGPADVLSVVDSRSRSFSIAVAANVRARGRILCTRARVFSAFPVLYRRRALRTGRPAVVIVFSRSSLSGV
jgi:hypothetical protein